MITPITEFKINKSLELTRGADLARSSDDESFVANRKPDLYARAKRFIRHVRVTDRSSRAAKDQSIVAAHMDSGAAKGNAGRDKTSCAGGRSDCRGGSEDEFPATKRRRAPRGRRKTPDIHVPQIPASAEVTCGVSALSETPTTATLARISANSAFDDDANYHRVGKRVTRSGTCSALPALNN